MLSMMLSITFLTVMACISSCSLASYVHVCGALAEGLPSLMNGLVIKALHEELPPFPEMVPGAGL